MNAVIVEGFDRICARACKAAPATLRLTTTMQRFKNWQLFAICVGVWGTTWHAITYQLSDLAPEFGVALRFAIAGCDGARVCALARPAHSLSAPRRTRHSPCKAASSTACRMSASITPSVSSPRAWSRSATRPRRCSPGWAPQPCSASRSARASSSAACSGWPGVALIFWPEIVGRPTGERGTLGALFTVASVLLSAVGSLVASRNRQLGVPLLPAMGFGMLYGAGSGHRRAAAGPAVSCCRAQ
jgi:hypothetical protein